MPHERWFLTLNEDGPKEYKLSLVLNRIQTKTTFQSEMEPGDY